MSNIPAERTVYFVPNNFYARSEIYSQRKVR